MGIIESIVNIMTFVLVMSEIEYDSEEERSLPEEPGLEQQLTIIYTEETTNPLFSYEDDDGLGLGYLSFLLGVTTTYFSTGCME